MPQYLYLGSHIQITINMTSIHTIVTHHLIRTLGLLMFLFYHFIKWCPPLFEEFPFFSLWEFIAFFPHLCTHLKTGLQSELKGQTTFSYPWITNLRNKKIAVVCSFYKMSSEKYQKIILLLTTILYIP